LGYQIPINECRLYTQQFARHTLEYEIGANRIYNTEIMGHVIYRGDCINFVVTIWNATSNHVQLCQIVELVYVDENTASEPWVMTRNRRTLDIDVNLSIGFTVGGGGGSGSGNDIGLEVQLSPGNMIQHQWKM